MVLKQRPLRMLCEVSVAVLKWAVDIEDRAALCENLPNPVKCQHAAAGGDHGRAEVTYLAGDLVLVVTE